MLRYPCAGFVPMKCPMLRFLVVSFEYSVYCFATESWYAGFGCFAVLLFWKGATIQSKLEEIRNTLRGFSDDDVLQAVKSGTSPTWNQKGLLGEIAVLLRDIRNNQMNNP